MKPPAAAVLLQQQQESHSQPHKMANSSQKKVSSSKKIGGLALSILVCLLTLTYQQAKSIALQEVITTILQENFAAGLPVQAATTTTTTTEQSKSPPSRPMASNNVAPIKPTTTNYRQSTNLPEWMKDYFDWHREQMAALNEENYREHKFLTIRCSNKERTCGGLADRLKALPFFVATAAYSNRILLIRWERPAKLEEFLSPNEVDWSVPDWLSEKIKDELEISDGGGVGGRGVVFINSAKRLFRGITTRSVEKAWVIEGLLQDFFGGSKFYYKLECELDKEKTYDEELAAELNGMLGWNDYKTVFRDLFEALFQPSPPVDELVREQMKLSGLVPGEYAASQYRAFYAVEHQKHRRSEKELASKTENGLNCASKVQPGAPIYFTSDSVVAVRHARRYGDALNHTIATPDETMENLHLDKMEQWTSGDVSDFYPTFADLLIMKDARCLSLGEGGYGRFANILSVNTTCVIRHDSANKKTISRCDWHNGITVDGKDGTAMVSSQE